MPSSLAIWIPLYRNIMDIRNVPTQVPTWQPGYLVGVNKIAIHGFVPVLCIHVFMPSKVVLYPRYQATWQLHPPPVPVPAARTRFLHSIAFHRFRSI